MMHAKLRDALSAVAMLVLVATPVVGVMMIVVGAFAPGLNASSMLGAALKFIFSGVIAGGILRTLTSIDARLEQRT